MKGDEVGAKVMMEPETCREGKRLALYWHNGRALGHASRMANIASALLSVNPSSSVMALTGMARGHEIIDESIDFIKLPSYSSHDSSTGVQRQPVARISQAELLEMRKNLISTFAKHYRPDLWLVDHHPRGWKGEMMAAVEQTPQAVKVLGLRGVMDGKEATCRTYFDYQNAKFIAENYSAIQLYIDQNVFDFSDYYRIPKSLGSKIQYTGYVARKCPLSKTGAKNSLGLDSGMRVMLASFGGGEATGELWSSLIDSLLPLRRSVDLLVLAAGPYLENGIYQKMAGALKVLRPCTVRWTRFLTNFSTWIRASDLFITAGGYNSLADILANEANALVVARHMSDAEQQIHARLLAQRGLIRFVERRQVTSGTLCSLLKECLATPLHPNAHGIRIDGAERSALHLCRLLGTEGKIGRTQVGH